MTEAIQATAQATIGPPTANSETYEYFNDFLLNQTAGTRVRSVYSSTGSMINIIAKNLIMLGGILFFALILFSGYKLIFMKDKSKALESTRQYLTTGVIGLMIMLAAYWIVRIIETVTGVQAL